MGSFGIGASVRRKEDLRFLTGKGKYTGADLQAPDLKLGGLPCGWLITSKDGSPMAEPVRPLLAQGKVRHVGDPVAVVVAETREQAEAAAELIEIDYRELP